MNHHFLHTAIYHSLMEQIAVIDTQGQIIDVNRAWIEFGVDNGMCSTYQWVNTNYLTALSNAANDGDRLAAEAYSGILAVIEGRSDNYTQEYPCHIQSEQRWFIMRTVPLNIGQKRYCVISHHNITQRKLAEMRTDFLANHDPLTSLANRRHFSHHLDALLFESQPVQTTLCLMMIDLDNFKHFNDTHGHHAGDVCLMRVADILQENAHLLPNLACRLGGDEFALLTVETTKRQAKKTANKVVECIRELHLVCGNKLQVTASVGGIWSPRDVQVSSQVLLNEADKILYQVKRAGKNHNQIDTLFNHPPTSTENTKEGNEPISSDF
ncbi:GGDEF domain-containing protein [Vibrio vulnificus]|uniref:GGDEF domain-containing protein n=1 Tax=Vibrio vulnificus TaxID=672 RepID=UPI003EDA4734